MSTMKSNASGVEQYRMYINGEWVESASGNVIEVENPTTEEIFATVPAGNAEDGQRALESSRDAQPAWAALPAVERGNLLMNVADKIAENREHLARLLSMEQGKNYALALGEVDATVDYINFPAQGARRMEGDIYPSDLADEHIWIHKVPYGVTVGLAAWNFPLALAGRKFGPSLVAGNTMVVKPPSITPVAVVEMAQLAHDAGLPPGVLNVVTGGGGSIGTELVSNPITRLVTMTGSVGTGQQLYRLAADNITEIRLELGGKAPFIVMDDADIDKTVEAALVSRFLNCGQVCTCNERMYVHDAVYDEFMEKFIAGASKITIGDPLEDSTDMGPKVCREELESIEAMVQGAVDEGCTVALGGKRPEGTQYEKGHWYEPTVLTNATNQMKIMQEEIFGPIVPVARIGSFDEALKLANDSDFGLAAYIFTNNMRNIQRLVRELDFGEIYVNRPIGEQRQGFHNGYKLSGTGGEDGKYGMENYLQKKTFYTNFS
jgi:lactaldehyde dehydrogenase / glycolaldehyde dehydrogenase